MLWEWACSPACVLRLGLPAEPTPVEGAELKVGTDFNCGLDTVNKWRTKQGWLPAILGSSLQLWINIAKGALSVSV